MLICHQHICRSSPAPGEQHERVLLEKRSTSEVTDPPTISRSAPLAFPALPRRQEGRLPTHPRRHYNSEPWRLHFLLLSAAESPRLPAHLTRGRPSTAQKRQQIESAERTRRSGSAEVAVSFPLGGETVSKVGSRSVQPLPFTPKIHLGG